LLTGKTNQLKKIHPVILSTVSGILLWLSWPVSPLTPFIFFGFVPLLLIVDLGLRRVRFFGHAFLAMFIWNAGSTWWIWNSTDVGSIAAIVANSLLMCLPWWGYHIFKQKFGKKAGYFSFICFWMCFEYIHLNWELSWPWLNLGNAFASQADWVQWYEYTGIGGGTLWVLVLNVLMYDWLFGEVESKKSKVKRGIAIVCLLVLPIGVSLIIEVERSETLMTKLPLVKENVLIIQPNIDPYGKFGEISVEQQIEAHLQLSEQNIDSNTRLIIWPETALSANTEINDVQNNANYKPVFDFINRHPNITLLSGIETYRLYGTEKPNSAYARKTPEGIYYDSYNAAVSIKAGQALQFYVKSKLVPGVERLPSFLNFMGPVFEKFGGTTGGYAMDSSSIAFRNLSNPYITAPIICYESIYGEYVASYVSKGANLLTIMTNDGWWGNTPGHKQHLQYARLRAIETRKWIARSANTGISAVIDNLGEIKETQPWAKAAVLKYNIPISTGQTFYVKNGDYLYKIFSLLAGLLVLWNVIVVIRKRVSRK
jgi:apolipoprotein N-acyltransferase